MQRELYEISPTSHLGVVTSVQTLSFWSWGLCGRSSAWACQIFAEAREVAVALPCMLPTRSTLKVIPDPRSTTTQMWYGVVYGDSLFVEGWNTLSMLSTAMNRPANTVSRSRHAEQPFLSLLCIDSWILSPRPPLRRDIVLWSLSFRRFTPG